MEFRWKNHRPERKNMKSILWVLLLLCNSVFFNVAIAAEAASELKKIPTLGITADGLYPVYKINEVVKGQYFIVRGQMYSNGDLLGRMIIVSERDARSGKYQCNFLCRNSQLQVIGINPLYAGMIQMPMRPAVRSTPQVPGSAENDSNSKELDVEK